MPPNPQAWKACFRREPQVDWYEKTESMEKQTVHSEALPANGAGRRYFFDLRKTEQGQPYMSLTESRKDKENEGQYHNFRLTIFAEDLEAFNSAFERLVSHFRKHLHEDS